MVDWPVVRWIEISTENFLGDVGGGVEGLVEAENEVGVVECGGVDDSLVEVDEQVWMGEPESVVAEDVELAGGLVEFGSGAGDGGVDLALVALGEARSLE